MSRNKIKTNQNIFLKFEEFIQTHQGSFNLPPIPRWISSTANEGDQIMNAKLVDKLILTGAIAICIYIWHQKYYLITSGLHSESEITSNLVEIDLPNGIVTAFIVDSEIEITKASDLSDIYQKFSIMPQIDDTPAGYAIDDVLKFFPIIKCYEIMDYSSHNIVHSLFKIINSSKRNLYLPIKQGSLDNFEEMVVSDRYPSLSILEGLISHRFESLFLSSYHAIEIFYGIPKLLSFQNTLNIPLSPKEIAKALEDVYGVRQREEEAICDICNAAQGNINTAALTAALDSWLPARGMPNIGKKIYKIRNSIVHSRLSTDRPVYDRNSWNTIIYNMTQIALTLR
ncbi:hypothetical protein [Deinococcus daejeonensis]|uniref:Apea-like HEPN domain-containing protein n=1 Tax=Deinococcus daejeonensis TaxID=1007098 RepID=A0ABQ2J911_9DEIO|nr:hypothetical protein [Deinococcus daejeonensis]GGN40609.1 hypothetical protein GCM10010842_25650 [Deinococcus daejeonensis]